MANIIFRLYYIFSYEKYFNFMKSKNYNSLIWARKKDERELTIPLQQSLVLCRAPDVIILCGTRVVFKAITF